MASKIVLGKLVALEDSIQINAKHLIDFVLPEKTDSIEILCLEKSPIKWKQFFNNKSNLNCYSEITSINEVLNKNLKSHTILIDSINQLAALTKWGDTINIIDRLSKQKNVDRLILIIHNDCLLYGDKMIDHLSYMCQTYIQLEKMDAMRRYEVKIKNALPSGKVMRTQNNIYFDTSDDRWKIEEVKTEDPAKKKSNVSKDELIKNMASFKIAVDRPAEMVKNDLILPYTQLAKSSGKSIVIEPDLDDWDDEDPDDDLDI